MGCSPRERQRDPRLAQERTLQRTAQRAGRGFSKVVLCVNDVHQVTELDVMS